MSRRRSYLQRTLQSFDQRRTFEDRWRSSEKEAQGQEFHSDPPEFRSQSRKVILLEEKLQVAGPRSGALDVN
ncbi:MAG: hypothetical protein ACR2FO_08520 [Actinomycetota bacterium]